MADEEVKQISFAKLVNWSPKQKDAVKAALKHDYVLYGGAVGGGKSYWLRWYPIRQLIEWHRNTGIKNIVAGLFCEDYPALKDRHLSKIALEFPEWLGTRHGDHKNYGNCFILNEQFGSGVLAFRNLDDPSKYQSAEFALIAVDELTKNQKDTFDFLRLRKRWPGLEHTKFIAGTNPGGVGHAWVKQIWMDGDFDPNEAERDQFVFVPALAVDNPYLPQEYYRQLEGLPEEWRRAYLEGDWDLFRGQFFTEFRRTMHVTRPFPIPASFRKFMGIDFGSTAPFAAYWIAVDWDGNYWVYREYYKTGENAANNAKAIINMTPPDEVIELAVVDRAVFAEQGYGESIADILRRNGLGQPCSRIPFLDQSMGGKDSRIARAQLMRQKLFFDDYTAPRLRFFETCPNAIRSIPSLIHDEKRPEDVDCFVAGTLITTNKGDIPIEKIQNGDAVLTPCGFQRAYITGTPVRTEVVLIECDNGQVLVGTAYHKVFIEGKGLVEMQQVQCDDTLVVWNTSNMKNISPLFTMALSTAGIMTGDTTIQMVQCCQKGECHCIGRYTQTFTAPFQRVLIYTTRIIIAMITVLKILSYWKVENTHYFTTEREQTYKALSSDGVVQKKGRKHYALMLLRCARELLGGNLRAFIVERLLKHNLKNSNSALNTCNGKDSDPQNVVSVGRYFGKEKVPNKVKPVRIRAVGRSGVKEVYKLRVENTHLYYANGFLVTNTNGEDHAYDAITYLLQKLEDIRVEAPLTSVEEKLRKLYTDREESPANIINERFNISV